MFSYAIFQLQLRTANEKAMTYVIITDDDEDILFIVAQTLALLQYNFPGSQRWYGSHVLL